MGNFTSTADATFTPSDAFFLCEAARTGAVDIVRLFLKKNFGLVYATNSSDKSTPWHVAAAAGHDVIVRVLIDNTRSNAVSNNFDPISKVINKPNAKGQTPLMLACGGGHSVCVRLLLESGAHLLVADATGQSALHYAALHCRPDGKGNDCVDMLLGHMQQQLIAQGPVTAPPAVHANVIRKFADAGDMYGRTALHCAAWSGNTRAAHSLWAVGADICARTDSDCYDAELPCNNGTTPLHFAAMRGHQAVVVLLLAAWHRMAARPGAPLPRPTYFAAAAAAAAAGRSVMALAPSSESGGEGRYLAGGLVAAGAAQGGSLGVARKEPMGEQQQELELDKHTEGGKQKDEELRAGGYKEARNGVQGEADAGEAAAAAAGPSGAAAAAASTGEAAGVEGTSSTEGAANGGSAEGAAGGIGAGLAAAGTSSQLGASARASTRSSEGGDGNGSGGGSASGRSGSMRSVDALTELPPPPPPRPPAMDPRLMVDAYGMTPYTIAGKRKQERGSMLLELLDPTTDFGADSSSDDDNDDDEDSDGDADGRDSRDGADSRSDPTRRRLSRGRGRRRRATGDDDLNADDDDDANSEAAAAGPLLLWEGVELVRDIAADPEGFFRMQRTVSLLQPQHEDHDGGTSSIGAPRPPPATSTTTEVVPDCFLCPLTCKVFRDPVVAADGVSYEREAIERHLRLVHTSPVTRQRLPSKQLYDNRTLKTAVEQWSVGLLPPPGSTGAGARRGPGGTGLMGRP